MNDLTVENGTIIADRFEVFKTLGVGGMGTVVSVKDKSLDDEIFALKILNPELASDKVQLGRFRNEVILARRLSHPNIARIYDFGSGDDDNCYLSMEFVEGGTLTDRIYSSVSLEFTYVCKYLLDMCDGLAYAHRMGIIHRDLKPDNVLLDKNDNAKITDFGLARSLTVDKNFTITGETVGTPHYMSPEQLAGEELTEAADIYSLGIVAFEMALKRRPFISDSYFELARMHMESSLPNVTELDPSLPAWFSKFLDLATAKRINDRFQNCEDVADFIYQNIGPEIKDLIFRTPYKLSL